MKPIYLFHTLFLFVATLGTSYSQVNFEALSIKEALVKAEQEGKKVFVDVYTTWCGPCKWMDAEVFSDSALGKRLAKSYVAIKIDKEKSPYRRQLYPYYIKGFPTMLILDAKGLELGQLFGRHTLEEVHQQLDKYDAIKGHPVSLAMTALDQKPQEQAVWKENLKVLMEYNHQFYQHEIADYYKQSCKAFYQQFDIVVLKNALDLDIFRQVQPPLEHPAAQFYVNDSLDYASYLHQRYQVQVFKQIVATQPDAAALAQLRTQVEKYYDDCYKASHGDIAEKSWFMQDIFGGAAAVENR